MDTLDDLQHAEDMLGVARATLDQLVKAVANGSLTPASLAFARTQATEVYCRPTCGGNACTNSVCGCPHHDGEDDDVDPDYDDRD